MPKPDERYRERLQDFKVLVPLCKTTSDERLLHDVLTSKLTFEQFTAGKDPNTYDLSKLAALRVARTLNGR